MLSKGLLSSGSGVNRTSTLHLMTCYRAPTDLQGGCLLQTRQNNICFWISAGACYCCHSVFFHIHSIFAVFLLAVELIRCHFLFFVSWNLLSSVLQKGCNWMKGPLTMLLSLITAMCCTTKYLSIGWFVSSFPLCTVSYFYTSCLHWHLTLFPPLLAFLLQPAALFSFFSPAQLPSLI